MRLTLMPPAADTDRRTLKEVLQPMPRRARRAAVEVTQAQFRDPEVRLPDPSTWMVAVRVVRALVVLVRFILETMRDAATGDKSIKRRGERLRAVFERLGGTAVKIGQQVALRVDFLPFELCQELGKLMDRVNPFPSEEAVAEIERSIGKPLSEVFARFDMEPIGAASIACVYRARLLTGEEVAIKVRRPHVELRFMTDLHMLDVLTVFAERLTLVRPNTFRALRTELRAMLLEELDLRREANFQTTFRRYTRRDKIKWLTAPRVFHELSSERILVTEFVRGYKCIDILRVVDTQEPTGLAILDKAQIDAAALGKHVLDLSMWMRLECPFFHSDPHPGNILVLPGGKLVMLDFGACGLVTRKAAADDIELARRFNNRDLSGAAQVMINTLGPLPDVDIVRFRKAIERSFFNLQVKVLSKDAEWWERTTTQAFFMIAPALEEFNIPPNIATMRLARANLLYDTIAYRLDPTIDFKSAYRRWAKDSQKRAKRKTKAVDIRLLGTELSALQGTLQNGLYAMSTATRDMPARFVAVAGKGAFVVMNLLKLMFLSAMATAVSVSVALVSQQLNMTLRNYFELALRALRQPIVVLVIAFFAYLILRRIAERLSEPE